MAWAVEPGYPGMLAPPPGVTPNLTNPQSIGWRLVLAGVLFPAIAILFWLLRLYTSHFIVRKLWPDDWLIVIAIIFSISLSALDIAQTSYGLGAPMWDVSPLDFQRIIVVGIGASVSYNLSTLFVKASILLFYLRFAAANRPFQIVVYLLLIVVAGYSLNAGFSFLYLCSPIRRLWDFSIEGTCIDLYTAYLVSSILNAVTDVIILLLPIWLLYPLRTRLPQKISVGLALMTGGFVCAVSVYRVVTIPQGRDDLDTTWRYCINNIWCLVELNVGIICACLPSLAPFAKRHFPTIFQARSEPNPHDGGIFGVISTRRMRVRVWNPTEPTSNVSSGSHSHDSASEKHTAGWGASHGNPDSAPTNHSIAA